MCYVLFFFSSRRRHTRSLCDWSSDVCSSDLRDIRLVVATDAACEGLNLQTLGTLINVDLPWNPSRLEQRLGRIKRFRSEERRVGKECRCRWCRKYDSMNVLQPCSCL